MAKIARLPLQVANQIAAGEVIERPASVVKELVENSLDAGARRIVIEVAQGGRWLRIVDDGEGMDPTDAVAAFDRFATSKLRDADELWTLATMGFRGEALASIASIARVECLTRPRGGDRATRVTIVGGGEPVVKPAGAPEGTTITVDDLFFNTPARLKFLRAAATEQGHIQDVVIGLALAHPAVEFRLVINQREVLSTVGARGLRDVVAALFGADAADAMVDVAHQGPSGKVSGLASRPDRVRGDRSRQWFFVNRRWVKHPLLARAVEEAYQGHIPGDRRPAYVLFLELDPAAVDVNVHPAKKEIRLGQTQRVYLMLLDAVRMGFAQAWTDADYAPAGDLPAGEEPAAREDAPQDGSQDRSQDASALGAGRSALPPAAWQRGPAPSASEHAAAMALYARPEATVSPALPGLVREPAGGPYVGQPGLPRELEGLRVIAQLHLTYILCEHPEGLFLLDQHNSHERWLYEQLAPAGVVAQELLLPQVLNLSPAEAGAASEFQARFAELGFTLEAFGGDRWILRAIPALLPLGEAERTVRELLSRTEAVGVVVRQPDDDPLRRTVACHAAVRAGDVLTMAQMEQIVARLRETKHPLTCPHGRPTGIMISMKELARRCLRT